MGVLSPLVKRAVVTALIVVCATTLADGQAPAARNIIDVLTTLPEYTGFVNLLRQEGLLASLRGLAEVYPITVFAPRNQYLKKHVDKNFLAFLQTPAEQQLYREILLYHFTREATGMIDYSKFRNMLKFASLQGSNLTITRDAARMRYNVERSPVRKPNVIVSSRGVVHGINGLLLFKEVMDLIDPIKPNTTCK